LVLVFGGFSGGAVEGGVYSINTKGWEVREEHGGKVADAGGGGGRRKGAAGKTGVEAAGVGKVGGQVTEEEQGKECPVARFAHFAGVVDAAGKKVRREQNGKGGRRGGQLHPWLDKWKRSGGGVLKCAWGLEPYT
jgi:hypothetical protein